MISLLLAAVLATSVGQLLFCFVIIRYRWYHPIARALVVVCCTVSTAGAFGFIFSQLLGAEALRWAVLYAGFQAVALWLVLVSRLYEVFSEDSPALQTVAARLGNMETSDEDRFSEKEVEQGEVRGRLDKAESKQDEKLDEHGAMLKEILRLLRRGR